ncbi:alpha/beta hydrolase [Glaciimonas soli]|uniref:Carboxylesterase n=1 Tax=Glaciimonas soli TaxID=2590999 RepID=A0A843YW63_9BURK|nr:alpha/beta hydrolase [Glaciimonas soli]MQR01738.1 carboxylesterase [Glaciimonas soli]
MTTLLHTTEITTSSSPTASVIWMHGLGADGSDFVPIVKELDLTGCPGIRFIFPDAPTMPVTINNGYVMPAWYDIRSGDLIQREDEAGLRKSQTQIEALIAQERARGIAADKIIIAGFSQGCAMALQIGLRHPEKLAGLMCLSGYLPLSDKIAAERNVANQDTPIFMAHGRMDPVVVLDRAEKSRDLLKQLGYQIEWHEYMMPHSVCADEVGDIGKWLRSVLAAA